MVYALMLTGLSFVVGILGGITGTGGVLIAPIMITAFGTSAHIAMGSAQTSYIIPSILAVVLFVRKGQLNWSLTWPLVLVGSVCTFISAQWLKPHLNSAILTLALAACIFLAGGLMLKPGPLQVRELSPYWRKRVVLLAGVFVGILSGITGSGGNAILAPVLTILGMNIMNVLAACQTFTVLTASAGTIGNVLNNALDWYDIVWLIFGQMAGVWVGVSIAQRIDTVLLKKVVGTVCVCAGLFIFARSALSLVY